MAYLRIAEARAAAQSATTRVQKSASTVLREEARAASYRSSFDVFLSHSFDDAEVILGVKKILESLGLSVYVDWIDDATLDRSTVTSSTAKVLRERLRSSTSLVYAHSENATNSKWMPWELGYFDGFRPKFVWILPLVTSYDSEFKGQEYIGIYPTIDKLTSLPGRINLGFENIHPTMQKRDLPLAEATKGGGVYLTR